MVTGNNGKSRLVTLSGSKLVAKSDFTKKRIDLMVCPATSNRAYFYDAKVRGLALAVTPRGKKVFVLYRKVAGRPERIALGAYPDLTIEQARGKAEALNSKIAMGENPAVRLRALRDEDTLGDLFAAYAEHHGKRMKTWAEHERRFRLYLYPWRLRKLSDIRRLDVVTLHKRIGDSRGPYAANRLVEMLSAMFNRNREWGWDGQNPASGVRAFTERKRSRFLEGDELTPFFTALAQEPNETIRDFILLSLLTGARRRNVESMRWEEIVWERATWIIPATKAKEDQPIDVALSAVAFRILEIRKADSTSEWVFPGNGRTGHLVEAKATWTRVVKRAGLTDLRLHDLRRTLGSWEAATGASLAIIGKTLGHQDGSPATKVYARLNLDPVRVAVTRATAAMLTAGGVAGLLEEGKE
jgi:integrase